MVASECLDDATVARLVADEVSPDERLEILAHADGCEDCRELLVAVAGHSSDRTQVQDDDTLLATHGRGRRRTEPRPGDTIDHYTVVEVLGHGGMGLVVHARDSELGRDVALKLLIHTGSEDAERRLVREAQAMAQLSHRNVVTVHAVGRYDHGVYIAMELVRGMTLGRWCERTPRRWDEILRAYLEAAEGLAAAHAVGLVHRDFKPDNVLVGHDGRVLVTDFGLAGVAHSFAGTHSQERESLELSSNLTMTGAVMGTPRFMSPEQYRGSRTLDAEVDQFAFGVALYHALYGSYPFEGDNVESLRASVSEGVPVAPPSQADVPRAVWLTIQTCIEREPSHRHPSMRAVIRQFRRILDAPARRRRTILAGVLGAGLLAGGVALGVGIDEPPPQPCAQIEERIVGTWDEARAQQVAQALESAQDSEAGAETIVRVKARLDAYAGTWVESAREACEATHVHGVRAPELLDAQTRCLDERRVALDALVNQLIARPADEVLARAVTASSSLPSIEACADRRPGLTPLAPELEAELAELATLLSLGAYEEAEREAVELDPRIDDARGRARLMLTRGRANGRLGRIEIALGQLSAAAMAAAEAGDDYLMAQVQIELMWVHTAGMERYGSADILLDQARVALRRVGDPPDLRRRLSLFHANVLLARESFTKALEELERGLQAVDQSGGDELARAAVLEKRATALASLDRADEAIDDAMFVLQARRQQLGEHHPKVAAAHQGLARTLLIAGRVDEGEQHLHETIRAIERRDGPTALAAAEPLMMLGTLAMTEGDPVRGVEHAERSLEILVQHGQGDSPHAASVRSMIGVGYSLQEKHEEAREILEQVIKVREQAGGLDDPAFAVDLHMYAEALRRGGHCDKAIPVFERLARVASEESEFVAFGLTGSGLCRVQLGLPEAESQLQKALARHEVVPLDDHERGVISFGLAQVRWDQGRHDEARTLAQTALDLVVPEADRVHNDIAGWLAEHGGDAERSKKKSNH